ncbi:universal stress protein UspC [Enterobacteriaceae bacterium ESL0689]|nr:universal stress protein UspC [Enterobacteriaceae bacterium ESL0689]
MPYSHLLVTVAPTLESSLLVSKAVSIARPYAARISLITLNTDPELYNQFAAPMLDNLRDLMQEETHHFLCRLVEEAKYPIDNAIIASGDLCDSVKDFCLQQQVDLVVCGNHNHSLFSRATSAAKSIVSHCGVDVLLVSLE